ncbi:MAG: acyloxyacyl hydrolase [Desulfobacterales bacterium]|nr:MAG: acyloxyacyl hydrolase [Desulfobacterales bacterium]
MVRTLLWTLAAALLISWAVFSSDILGLDWQMLGLRGGVSDNRNEEDFKQYEGVAAWNLPWSWELGLDCAMTTYIEANAGVLTGGGESAFVGSIGPGLYFTGLRDSISIYLGVNPTIISRHEFGDDDLGGPFQFTSHIGIDLNITRRFAVGYRLQHMSNFVLYDSNPGLNLHMIEGAYRF